MKFTELKVENALCVLAALALCVAVVLPSTDARAQSAGSAFTYQGQLKEGGVPADGPYDFRFTLYDDLAAVVSGPITVEDHPVTNGLFSVILDFAGNPFTGDARFLEIAVRPGESTDVFTVLSPRQELTPTPYAATALETVGVDGHSLDAADGEPADAVFVASNGRVNMSYGGLEVYDEAGHGVSFTSNRITFDEFPSEDPVYDYVASTKTHRFFTNGISRLEIAPDGNVGIGQTNPSERLDVNGTVKAAGLRLGTSATSGHVLTTDANGVGTWQAPSGGGSTPWNVDGDDNIYYGDGNVGINMGSLDTPLYPLHVAGTAMLNGLKLGDAATPGHVLTTDASGVGTWQAPSGGGSTPWEIDGEDNIYYGDGNVGIGTGAGQTPVQKLHVEGTAYIRDRVGIGTTTPDYPLHVTATSGSAIVGQTSAPTGSTSGVYGVTASVHGHGVHGESTAASGWGVYGEASGGVGVEGHNESPTKYAVYGCNEATSGDAVGVYGESASPTGRGVFGYATTDGTSTSFGVYGKADSTWGRGVYGEGTGSNGYGGYFVGRGYFSGNVGIGTTPSATALDVNGEVQADGFKYSSPKERQLTLPIFAFRPVVSDYISDSHAYIFGVDWRTGALLYVGEGLDPTPPLVATVNLPDGAQITEMTVYVIDEDVVENCEVRLYRMSFGIEYAEYIAALTSSGSGGIQTLTTSVFADPVIDNSSWAYYVTVGVEEGQDWIGNDIRPRAVVITYTVDEAD